MTGGLLLAPYVQEYTTGLVNGVRSAFFDKGYDLVLVGETYQEYDYARREHFIGSFACAAAANLDVYIVMIGVLRQLAWGDEKTVQDCLSLLPHERTLIIEDEVKGYRCLFKDNIPGMHEVMQHILDVCGYRRVGFISGSEMSFGARQRETVYFEEMKSHGLPVEDRWFVRGRFDYDCRSILNDYVERNPDLQAMICANDSLALQLYQVLEKHGLTPGKDVAVTGYDDQPRASAAHPPLTTVCLDPFDFGYIAGTEAIRLMCGEPQKNIAVRGRLVVRASTGQIGQRSRDLLDQYIKQDPFPVRDIVRLIMDASVKHAVARDNSRYYWAILGIVEATKDIYQCVENPMDIYAFLDAGQREFAEGAIRGEFRYGDFQSIINEYLYALLRSSSESVKDKFVRLAIRLNQSLARFFNTQYLKSKLTTARQELAISQIIKGSLNTTDSLVSIRSMMEGVNSAGCKTAYLLLPPDPVATGDDVDVETPTVLYIKATVLDGELSVFGTNPPTIAMDELVTLCGRHKQAGTYAIIGLYENHELLGFFAVELKDISFSTFYYISLQITYALRHVQIVQDEQKLIGALDKSNVQLRLDSQTDALSGLLNRRGFIERLRSRLASPQTPYGVLFYVDLDRFKTINDTYGHDEGDDAIRSTGEILRRSLRVDDLVSRAGGDEFIMFANISRKDEVKLIYDRIERNFARFNETAGKCYQLYASIGTCCFEIERADDVESLLVRADEDLYQVKRLHHAMMDAQVSDDETQV